MGMQRMGDACFWIAPAAENCAAVWQSPSLCEHLSPCRNCFLSIATAHRCGAQDNMKLDQALFCRIATSSSRQYAPWRRVTCEWHARICVQTVQEQCLEVVVFMAALLVCVMDDSLVHAPCGGAVCLFGDFLDSLLCSVKSSAPSGPAVTSECPWNASRRCQGKEHVWES